MNTLLLGFALLAPCPVASISGGPNGATSQEARPRQERRPGPDVNAYPRRAAFPDVLRFCTVDDPEELFDVLRVVDGDTIWIERNGERDKLRLLGVDTEEKYMERQLSPSKPSTRYGDHVTGWAQGFFTPRSADESPIRVGLRFPGGQEARDPYGRLLCHVVTEQGVDFNLLLVRMGMSPYFDKYGNSLVAHEEFVAAQALARRESRGIWNEQTNEGGASRDYDRLLPWWRARAMAVDAFRKEMRAQPKRFIEADDPEALQVALDASRDGDYEGEVTVLGLIDRFFEEDDGSRTVLMRGGDPKRSLRVRIPAAERAAMEDIDLEGTTLDFRQNYLLVTGRLAWGERGFDLVGVRPRDWRRAGPEPEFETRRGR